MDGGDCIRASSRAPLTQDSRDASWIQVRDSIYYSTPQLHLNRSSRLVHLMSRPLRMLRQPSPHSRRSPRSAIFAELSQLHFLRRTACTALRNPPRLCMVWSSQSLLPSRMTLGLALSTSSSTQPCGGLISCPSTALLGDSALTQAQSFGQLSIRAALYVITHSRMGLDLFCCLSHSFVSTILPYPCVSVKTGVISRVQVRWISLRVTALGVTTAAPLHAVVVSIAQTPV
jgi:hypothetical protein